MPLQGLYPNTIGHELLLEQATPTIGARLALLKLLRTLPDEPTQQQLRNELHNSRDPFRHEIVEHKLFAAPSDVGGSWTDKLALVREWGRRARKHPGQFIYQIGKPCINLEGDQLPVLPAKEVRRHFLPSPSLFLPR